MLSAAAPIVSKRKTHYIKPALPLIAEVKRVCPRAWAQRGGVRFPIFGRAEPDFHKD